MRKFLLILFFSINLYSIDNKPNIIIILTDDLGWGDVSYNGGPIPTPNIDKLANDGLRMNRFYSAPTCSPTRAALFTGLNSLTNGIIRPLNNPTAERYGLSLKHKIMPEYFKEMGYQTALSGKWHLGMFTDDYLPRNRGFDSTYGHLGGGIGYFDHALAGRLDWHRNGEILHEDGYSTTLIADEAIRIIKNKDTYTPLLLYVAFNAPHTPIEAEDNVINELLNIKDEKERNYAANIISLDREIGKIINTIDSEEILDETIIIFFSDNGPVFDIDPIAATIAPDILDSKGNTLGLKGSKGSAYEGGIRVPGIIYYKGVLEKSVSNQFFFSDDILPTLLTAINYDKDRNYFTGVDRWESLKSNNIQEPKNVITGNVIVNDERALFNNQWKLYYRHFIYDDNSKKIFELYDVQNDPYEKNNLSSQYPDIFESMKKTLINMPVIIDTPYINPVQSYLYGDRYIGITESPWLKREYEEKNLPHPIVQNIIFAWIIFLTFKQFIIPILVIFIFLIYLIIKKNKVLK
tara:strand:- start:966 stop:2525 length:1560 start_codon:yes stop_codon:yes gene_type:complete